MGGFIWDYMVGLLKIFNVLYVIFVLGIIMYVIYL